MGFQVSGRSKEDEMKALEEAIVQVKSLYEIDGIVYGGISSNYQKQAFEQVCVRQKLQQLHHCGTLSQKDTSPNSSSASFRIIIAGVSTMGLDKGWLGTGELDKEAIDKLMSVSKKCGFNLTFEGGEG